MFKINKKKDLFSPKIFFLMVFLCDSATGYLHTKEGLSHFEIFREIKPVTDSRIIKPVTD